MAYKMKKLSIKRGTAAHRAALKHIVDDNQDHQNQCGDLDSPHDKDNPQTPEEHKGYKNQDEKASPAKIAPWLLGLAARGAYTVARKAIPPASRYLLKKFGKKKIKSKAVELAADAAITGGGGVGLYQGGKAIDTTKQELHKKKNLNLRGNELAMRQDNTRVSNIKPTYLKKKGSITKKKY